MEVITLTSEAFTHLTSLIENISKRLDEKEPKDKWLDNQDVMEQLHISKRLLQSWRDDGILTFSQVGGKIFYKQSDIDEVLNSPKHKKRAFAKK